MSSVPPERTESLGRVAILGLGAMGGSLARAVTERRLAERVTGWSPDAGEREAALAAGAIDLAARDWKEAVEEADLVALAVPLGAAVRLLPGVVGTTGSATTLTDVTSLQGPVMEVAERAGAARRWVGGHPMAGSESTGFRASRSDLYDGARVWLVAHEASDEHLRRVERLWRGVGGEPRSIGADAHDRLMALVSHLPQLVSNVLARILDGAGVPPDRLGPGGRDMTRLAGSDPAIWLDLIDHAPPVLIDALRTLGTELEQLADLVEAGDVEAIDTLMRRSRAWRSSR